MNRQSEEQYGSVEQWGGVEHRRAHGTRSRCERESPHGTEVKRGNAQEVPGPGVVVDGRRDRDGGGSGSGSKQNIAPATSAIARRMLEDGVPVEIVAKYSGLTKEDVLKLA